MTTSSEIQNAVAEFKKDIPDGCTVRQPQPRYALVKIERWPASVHYEFRFNKTTGLYVELHLEHKAYSWLGDTLSSCSKSTPPISGFQLNYSPGHKCPKPNQKRWPSLSIALGHHVLGTVSALIMKKLIEETRRTVTNKLGHH